MSDRVRKSICSGSEGNGQCPTGWIITHLVKPLPPGKFSKQTASWKHVREDYTLCLESSCVVCLWIMDGVEVCDDPLETGNVVLRRLQLPLHSRCSCCYCRRLHRLSLFPPLSLSMDGLRGVLAVAVCVRSVLSLLWWHVPFLPVVGSRF